MKKLLLLTLLSLSLFAEDLPILKGYQDDSLIAFEGGYSKIALNKTTPPSQNRSRSPFFGAFKIGAQSEHYRLYLAARYFHVKDYDYANALGVEIQYLKPLNNTFGIFFGLNSGLMNVQLDSAEGKREFSAPLVGGDFGLDIDVSKLIALQFGARYSSIGSTNTLLNSAKTAEINYSLDSILNLYMTLAFKFQLD